jgi:hypothetical protein
MNHGDWIYTGSYEIAAGATTHIYTTETGVATGVEGECYYRVQGLGGRVKLYWYNPYW